MNKFVQKFSEIAIKMCAADMARQMGIEVYKSLSTEQNKLINEQEELVSGVYDVEGGHVVITDGNPSFYAKDCND